MGGKVRVLVAEKLENEAANCRLSSPYGGSMCGNGAHVALVLGVLCVP